jgi:hypothetical protein
LRKTVRRAYALAPPAARRATARTARRAVLLMRSLSVVRADHTSGSVVRADAAGRACGQDPAMAYAEHRQEDLPVAFETATSATR